MKVEYEITTDGEVYRNGRQLKSWDNGRGYLILRIGEKTKAVHRLVAEVFLKQIEGLTEVNHKDGDKKNNHVSNLEWCSRGQNIKHAYDNNLRSAKGENNARALTTEKVVREICVLIVEGVKPSKIRDMGYCYSLVRQIKRKANWKYISEEYF